MKLVFYEVKKILCKKVFFIILALCFILNIGIFYYVQNNSGNSPYIFSDFPSMAEEYASVSLNKAEEMLKNESMAYEILSVMNMAAYAQTDEEMDNLLNTLAEYKKNEPKAYAEAENMSKSSDYYSNRESYINTLLQQVEYIKSYPSFIGEMYSRAEEQSSISIFSNQNDFSYKNLYKTAKDYQHLNDAELTMGNDIPITAALEYNVTDYFLIALVFLACVYLFNQERELGLYNLVRSSKHGRFRTIAAKLGALFAVTAVISVIFMLSNFAISSYMYGSYDFSRMVQSISVFRNCIFELNIGWFCLLNIIGKVAGMIVVSSVFALLFVGFSSSSLMYLVSVGIFAVEYLFKSLVSGSTSLDYPKYINLFYMLDGKNFWGSYLNLNIFTNPVAVYFIDLIVFSAVFVVCVAVSLIIFTFRGQYKKSGFLSVYAEKFKSKHFKIKGSTSVINGETYKYLIINKMALLLIAVAVFGVYSSFGTVSYPYFDKSDPAYKEYMEYLEGDITAEKEEYIVEQQNYFDKLNMRLLEIGEDSSLSESAKGVAQNTINNILETKGEAFNRVTEQYNRLLDLKNEGTDAKFIDENLYPDFIYSSSREWNNLALLLLALLISIPFIFTVDYKRGMINLLRPTKFGKFRLIRSKLTITICTLTILFASIYTPYFIRFISTFGTESLSVPIVCMGIYQNINGEINVIEAFLLDTACYFAIALLVAAVIALVSVLIKSHMLTIIISTILVLIPCLIIYPYKSIRVGVIFSERYSLYALLIISVSIGIALICGIITLLKFTNTRMGGKSNA